MTYVDGFLLAVPTARKEEYRKVAADMAEIFKDHGALTVVECWGDDVPDGEVNSMNSAVMRTPEETVVFSWVTWPSKEARDAGNQAMMEDERMPKDMSAMPFDGKRLIYGGFLALFER
ncbi:MAG: DUF1428 domain-containing protein [Pseudomonadota bacterium]